MNFRPCKVSTLRFAAVLAIALAISYFNFGIEYRIHHGSMLRGSRSAMGSHLLALLIAAITLIIFGILRVAMFHPGADRRYREWLELSPWTHPMPLPLGPATLQWGDWLTLGLASGLLALDAQLDPFLRTLSTFAPVYVLFCFALGYLLWASLQLLRAPRKYLITLVVAPPLFVLVYGPTLKLLVLISLLLIASAGIRKTLTSFPWPRAKPRVRDNLLGWPFDRLNPVAPTELVPRWRGVAIGLLAGWWTFAVARFFDGMRSLDPADTASFCLIVALIAAASRILRYCAEYHPPLWPIARLRIGVLLIPRYDRVFLAPLATIVIGWLLPHVLHAAGLPEPLVRATVVIAIIAAALQLGPSIPEWRLTGAHRMFAMPNSGKNDRLPLFAGGS